MSGFAQILVLTQKQKATLAAKLRDKLRVKLTEGSYVVEGEASFINHSQVKFAVFWAYAKSVKVYLAIGIVLFIVVAEIASVASGIWLARWSSASVTSDDERDMYLGVYGGLGFLQALSVLISTLCLAVGSKIASRYLHQSILVNVMHSPMSFFETTPLGRIVNRFSKDISTIDDLVPMSLANFLRTSCGVLGTIVAISYATPIFLAVILPLGVFYLFVQVQ